MEFDLHAVFKLHYVRNYRPVCGADLDGGHNAAQTPDPASMYHLFLDRGYLHTYEACQACLESSILREDLIAFELGEYSLDEWIAKQDHEYENHKRKNRG